MRSNAYVCNGVVMRHNHTHGFLCEAPLYIEDYGYGGGAKLRRLCAGSFMQPICVYRPTGIICL